MFPQKRIKIDIAFITPGMYVAQLDRSWLETPFAQRGFEIREEDQIQLLRKFCRHVYVDSSRSSVPERQILEAHASVIEDPFAQRAPLRNGGQKTGLAHKLLRLIGRRASGHPGKRSPGVDSGPISVPVTREFPVAAAAYKHASKSMKEILADVKNGKGVNVDRLNNAIEPVVDSIQRNPDAMAWLCYLRIRDNSNRSINITSSVWAVIMGRHLGLDGYGLRNLAMGGILLDIGNTQIPSSMFSTDGPPSEEEEEILRMHVDYGVKIARTVPGIHEDVISMIAGHHEHHDGSGYPNGLKGEAIPVYGRISSLINHYDEMVTHRIHAAPKSSYGAVCELNAQADKKFHREAVNNFVQAIGMFPTGSLIEMNTGEIAIVMEQNLSHRLRPKVMPVLDVDKNPLASRKSLDLSSVPDTGNSRKACWITKGHVAGAFGIDLKKYIFGSRKSK